VPPGAAASRPRSRRCIPLDAKRLIPYRLCHYRLAGHPSPPGALRHTKLVEYKLSLGGLNSAARRHTSI